MTEPADPAEAAPAWAYEVVSIAPYDPAWPARAAALIASLEPVLPGAVEHVGSTAVPGLPAKPIIDLQALVESFEDVDALIPALAAQGWHHVPPELDERPYRRFFVHVVADSRNAHLHLMQTGEPRWREQLRFRDRLRSDDRLRTEYAAVKQELAQAHGNDRERYSAAKAAFITDAMA